MSRERRSIVYINGEYLPENQAKISIFDHGFLLGDGVFDALRVYGGELFKLDDHIDRLYRSAAAVKIETTLTKEQMKEAVLETVRRNGLQDAYVRIHVTRGVGYPLMDPRSCETPTIVIFVHEPAPPPQLARTYGFSDVGRKVIIASTRRIPPVCLDSRIKSIDYLNSIMARLEAMAAGADEAIQLDIHGFVAEAASTNVFVVRDEKLSTPPAINVLEGITRATVIELASNLGYPTVERTMTPYDLYTADEVFLTGTAGEIVPVAEIDGRKIGPESPGPITKRLVQAYKDLTGARG
jgi:branched-chain amino acid aminotransferase